MKKYLVRRILQIIPVLLILSFIVFSLVFVAGDPVILMLPQDATQEEINTLREALGLDRPFIVQYGAFLLNMFQGDFGESYRYGEPSLDIVLERLPATMELAFAAFFVAVLVSVPLGIWSATRQNTILDLFITGGSVLGKAIPNFWMGIMLILILAVNFQIFPVSGRGTFSQLILPAVTLGTSAAAEMTRLVRSSMLEILHQDYVRTAKSKGLGDFFVVYKHTFRNALNPVITIMFLQISFLVSGALVTESVFAWPGLGQLLVQAVNSRDMAIVQAAVFVIAAMVIGLNLLADIIYRLLDPRIKYN